MKNTYSLFAVLILFLFLIPNELSAKSKSKKVKLDSVVKVYVPKTAHNFNLVETTKFPQKDYGVAFKYENKEVPQLRMDYYIYPMYKTVSIEHLMFAEYENVINGIRTLAERDEGMFSILNTEIVEFDNEQAIKTTMHTENKFGIDISELYMSSINNYYVKLRVSYPMYDSKEYGLRNLANSAFIELIKNTKIKSKKKNKYTVSLNTDILNEDDEKNMLAAIMYGVAVQAKLADNLIDSYNNFIEIYDATIEVVIELSNNKGLSLINEADENIDIFEVQASGFLKEFIWEAFKRPYWNQPTGLKLNDFNKWVEMQRSKKFISRPIGVNILIE